MRSASPARTLDCDLTEDSEDEDDAPAHGGGPLSGTGRLRDAVPVHEWLLDVGEGYREHLNALRARKQLEELLHVRDRPQITQRAKQKDRGGVAVEARLLSWEEKRRERIKRLKGQALGEDARQAEAEAAAPHRPTISEKAKQVSARFASRDWQQRREQKIRRLRAERQKSEEGGVTATPRINRHSRALAAGRPDRDGVPVEDYLLFSEKRRRQQLYYRHEEAVRAQTAQQPSITRRASLISRDGDFGERLHGQRIGAALGTPDAPGRGGRGVWQALQAQGSEETFQPRINPPPPGSRGAAEEPGGPVEERLMAKHRQSRKRMEDRVRMLEEGISSDFNRRHTSAQSEALYAAHRLAERQHGRIYGPAERGKEATPPPSPGEGPRFTTKEFLDRVAHWEELRLRTEHRCAQKRRETQRRELAECTFEPFKAPASRALRLSPSRRSRSSTIPDGCVADRSLCWNSRRESRLAAEKAKQELKAMEGCTFTPDISRRRAAAVSPGAAPNGSGITVGSGKAYGFDEFVHRMKAARNERARDDARVRKLFSTGEHWSGEVTVPEEFNFARRLRGESVAALERPVEPPRMAEGGSPWLPSWQPPPGAPPGPDTQHYDPGPAALTQHYDPGPAALTQHYDPGAWLGECEGDAGSADAGSAGQEEAQGVSARRQLDPAPSPAVSPPRPYAFPGPPAGAPAAGAGRGASPGFCGFISEQHSRVMAMAAAPLPRQWG